MSDKEHDGLVIFADYSSYRVFVVDLTVLEKIGMPEIRRVDTGASLSAPNNEVNTKMNVLKYGDVITWTDDEAEKDKKQVIVRFRRTTSTHMCEFPTRVEKGIHQVSMEGIVNPNDTAHLVTRFFRSIPIPTEQIGVALTNIFYNAWVMLKYNENTGRLDILFDSFHGVCSPKIQEYIRYFPWNKGNAKYSLAHMLSEENELGFDEWGVEVPILSRLPLELSETSAIRTKKRTVFLPDYPGIKALLAFGNGIMKMKKGITYKVSAILHKYEKVYLINGVQSSDGEKMFDLSPSGLFQVFVKENTILRGVFENDSLGLIDDPTRVLQFLHLSERAKDSIRVTVSDGCPSRGGQFRFYIENLHEEENFRRGAPEKNVLTNVYGVVVSKNLVFSIKHSPIFFSFNKSCKEEKPGIGSFLWFCAAYNGDAKKFYITEWKVDETKDSLEFFMRKMDPERDWEQPIFQVSGKVPDHNNIRQMLLTSEFGLVDDNLKSVEFSKERNPDNQYRVWVTFAHSSKDDPFCSRTLYHIVADAKNEPPGDRYEPPLVKRTARGSGQSTFKESYRRAPALCGPSNSDDCRKSDELKMARGHYAPTPRVAPLSAPVNGCRSENIHHQPQKSAPRSEYDLYTTPGLFSSRARQREPQNTGPVLMPPGSKNKCDVIKTMALINSKYNHSEKCGLFCDSGCPWLRKVTELVCKNDTFWNECTRDYPDIAEGITRVFINCNLRI